ncbi:SDR family NAD(P)-dependent oxidoreductase [candidate division KSB1 bacterium]|nr:SDR family NAD(P)-dependent oxidoreductase [bacterium]NUM68408.1 SDR family NAD(P)-dependent oxidoreductase [candidate division KSB1 bacterium]
MNTAKALTGKVAVVAGATRGAGRGIACALGEAGATVYCTGRSTRAALGGRRPDKAAPFALAQRRETIEETAELVTSAGGAGLALQVDHTVPAQVQALFERVKAEQGRLDILVNDIWGGDELTEFGTPFWELSLEKGLLVLQRAVHSHLITSRLGVPLMLNGTAGLIVEITDGDFFGYRGNLFYDLVKTSVIRLAFAMARELRRRQIAAVAVTPGFLRSEAMLDRFGVTADNWQEGAKQDADFLASETPLFVGRAVARLAADAQIMRKTGRVFSSWELAEEYGFTDRDGSRPNWGRYFVEKYGRYRKCDEAFYEYWWQGPGELVFPDWP